MEGSYESLFRISCGFLKKEKKSYIIGIILLLFVALLQLIPPKIIGFVADDIGSNRLTWGKWVYGFLPLL